MKQRFDFVKSMKWENLSFKIRTKT